MRRPLGHLIAGAGRKDSSDENGRRRGDEERAMHV
jgi:hypothetical protein